jgi:hypothetical protein
MRANQSLAQGLGAYADTHVQWGNAPILRQLLVFSRCSGSRGQQVTRSTVKRFKGYRDR